MIAIIFPMNKFCRDGVGWGQRNHLALAIIMLLAMELALSTAFMDNPALCKALCGDSDDDDVDSSEEDVPILRARSGWQARPPPMVSAPQWRPPPPPIFRPPQQQFRPPQQQFRPPQQQYRPPQQQFRQPQQQYRPPQQGFRPQQAFRPNYPIRPQSQGGYVPPPVNRPGRGANPAETKDTYGPDGWPMNKVWRNPGTTRPDPKFIAAYGNYFSSKATETFDRYKATHMAQTNCDYKWGNNYCAPVAWLKMIVPPRPIYTWVRKGKDPADMRPGGRDHPSMFPDINLPLGRPRPTPYPPNPRPAFKLQSNARPEPPGLPYVKIRVTDPLCNGPNVKDPSRCITP